MSFICCAPELRSWGQGYRSHQAWTRAGNGASAWPAQAREAPTGAVEEPAENVPEQALPEEPAVDAAPEPSGGAPPPAETIDLVTVPEIPEDTTQPEQSTEVQIYTRNSQAVIPFAAVEQWTNRYHSHTMEVVTCIGQQMQKQSSQIAQTMERLLEQQHQGQERMVNNLHSMNTQLMQWIMENRNSAATSENTSAATSPPWPRPVARDALSPRPDSVASSSREPLDRFQPPTPKSRATPAENAVPTPTVIPPTPQTPVFRSHIPPVPPLPRGDRNATRTHNTRLNTINYRRGSHRTESSDEDNSSHRPSDDESPLSTGLCTAVSQILITDSPEEGANAERGNTLQQNVEEPQGVQQVHAADGAAGSSATPEGDISDQPEKSLPTVAEDEEKTAAPEAASSAASAGAPANSAATSSTATLTEAAASAASAGASTNSAAASSTAAPPDWMMTTPSDEATAAAEANSAAASSTASPQEAQMPSLNDLAKAKSLAMGTGFFKTAAEMAAKQQEEEQKMLKKLDEVRAAAENAAKTEEDRKAKAEAEQKAKAEAEKKAKAEAEQKAKAEDEAGKKGDDNGAHEA